MAYLGVGARVVVIAANGWSRVFSVYQIKGHQAVTAYCVFHKKVCLGGYVHEHGGHQTDNVYRIAEEAG